MTHAEKILIILGFSVLLPSCSPSSVLSPAAALGTAVGVGAGIAGANIAADHDASIDSTKAAAVFGGAAGALGMAAGAMVHQNEVEEQKKQYYQRVPYETNKTQEQIDRHRQYIEESESWGRGEVKPYEDRYQIDPDRRVYQGAK